MEPKTEPEPEFFNFCYPEPDRNREIKQNGTGTGTAGTEIFLNGNKETIQVERNLKRQQLMISTSVCSEYFLRWHIKERSEVDKNYRHSIRVALESSIS
jgi:hypothetical protein